MKTSTIALLVGLTLLAVASGRPAHRSKRSHEGQHSKQDRQEEKFNKQRSEKVKRDSSSEAVEEATGSDYYANPEYSHEGKRSSYEGTYVSKDKKRGKSTLKTSSKKPKYEKSRSSQEQFSEKPKSRVEFEPEYRERRSPGTFTKGVLSNPELIVDTISDVPLPPVSPDHPGTRISLDPATLSNTPPPKFVPISTMSFEERLDQILRELRLWRLAHEVEAQRQATTASPEAVTAANEAVSTQPPASSLVKGEEVFRVSDVDTVDELRRVLQLYTEYTRNDQ